MHSSCCSHAHTPRPRHAGPRQGAAVHPPYPVYAAVRAGRVWACALAQLHAYPACSYSSEVGNASTVLGFIGTPWTLAAYSVEGAADKHCHKTKLLMNQQPAVLHALLAHLAENLGVYACHQIECGAQVVQLFDSWAHHLSPGQFAEFSLPYAERVMAIVRAKHPNVPLIFHANGSAGKERLMRGCSADVKGLDWATDMRDARAIFGDKAVLQGNVDPQVLFGPEAAIKAAVAECVAGAGQRHILNVGHGVAQGTPEEAVGLFCELARASRYDAPVAAR